MSKSFHSLTIEAQSKRWAMLGKLALSPAEAKAIAAKLPELMAARRRAARLADARAVA